MAVLTDPKNSLVKQYRQLFNMENVELEFTDKFLKVVVRQAISKKSGARGLRSIMESVLIDVMYNLPSMSNVSKVILNENVITEKADPLLILKRHRSEKNL
jgi:ATP-dependent Clp protease ATP-binding subunit ClpX